MTQTEHAPKPVAEDFEETIRFAGAQRERIEAIAGEAKEGGIANIWLVGCGGSHYAMSAAQYTLTQRGKHIVSFRLNANEFNHARPALVGADSLVVVGSHSGKTPETLEAIEVARSLGARTIIGMTSSTDSELAKRVDTSLHLRQQAHGLGAEADLTSACSPTSSSSAYGDESTDDLEAAAAGYLALPEALRRAIDQQDPESAQIAAELANEPITYVLGAGPNEDVARCLSMCYLQEMQWLHAAAFNAGEFFHGAFEMVTDDLPVILLLGEDTSRPVAERAARFIETHSKRTFKIDSKQLELPGVPAKARADVAPIALGTLVSRLAQHYEAVTGHDLDTRRYMFKVEY